MIKLIAAVSTAALLATGAANAQSTTTTTPSPTPPAGAEKVNPPVTAPAERVDKMDKDKLDKSATPAPSVTPSATSTSSLILSDDEAQRWIDKVVYSSDNQNLGEVSAFQRGTDNKVTEMHADIGGFLGLGETRVRLLPSEFKLAGDRVILNMTAEQAKALPKISK